MEFFIRSDGKKIPLITKPYCEICSLPLDQSKSFKYCYWCQKDEHDYPFDYIRTVEYYFKRDFQPQHVLSNEIRRFKINSSLAPLLGECLVHVIENNYMELRKFDLIASVPKATKSRPFDQAALLANHVSSQVGIPYHDLLYVKEEYPPLIDKDHNERTQIIRDKIGCRTKLRGESIILIDDVCSSKSTMVECARVLKIHGAGKVVGLVIGRNVDNIHLDTVGRTYES